MGFAAELIRPDDLLYLRVRGSNLVLDPNDLEHPGVVVEDPTAPAYLIVDLPPQAVAEPAYFEWDVVQAEDKQADGSPAPPRPGDPPQPTGMAHARLDPPGRPQPPRRAAAQIAGASRLVFKVPAGSRIPFTVAGLLDWSGLDLSVSPIAAIGPDPRSAQIAGAPPVSPPAPTETSIELPYRLVVSPNGDVAWRHRADPFTSRGRTELWHTRLALKRSGQVSETSALDPAPLRAIWSEDYRPDHPPEPVEVDPYLDRTAMAPNDRYQLVVLTSAFHGWVVDEELYFYGIRGRRFGPIKVTVPYVPAPFEAAELALSPLGGWLKSRGHWSPPRPAPPPPHRARRVDAVVRAALLSGEGVAARDGETVAVAEAAAAGGPTQLDLSEWVHQATLGRDHYVRIVYEGELWPFRHRAALVKVTERKFEEGNGVVGTYLMQRMFVVVREPVKTFSDRGNPFRSVRLTTLVTPNIAPPIIKPVPHTLRTFWVEVVAGTDPLADRRLFNFHGVATDVGGHHVDFTVPLLFVSLSDIGTPKTSNLPAVAAIYNDHAKVAARDLHVPGQQVVFAEPAGNDNTRLVTDTVNFVVDAAGNPPQMLKAEVRIPQVQELLGTDTSTTIAYYDGYVQGGFDAQSGVFARIARLAPSGGVDSLAAMLDDTLGVVFSADKAGGISTPNLAVSALTRALGPVAGHVADAVAGAWNPSAFFPPGTAKLFGTFDLSKLLAGGALGQNTPSMKTTRVGTAIETTLTWEPAVSTVDLGIAAFTPGGKTKLVVHGLIRKPLNPPGAAPTSAFIGDLNDFEVSVLKSVFISFVLFRFEARTGKKTDVTVTLDPKTPVRFDGDLKFVEEIRNAIPPGIFGDGPSLDISATGIRAGFSFTLPPLSVGVFALKDVTLAAALTLPFTDGKPLFDFNVSERAHPFLLTVSLFAGGGFFHLQLDTGGMRSLEVALEFGAAAAIDIGVASGEVHIMAGIYFGLQRKEGSTELTAVLSGYLRMGGSLSVLGLVKVSVEFNLSFTYDSGRDKAFGRATLTVQVSVACFSKSVSLTVERGFGGSGDPTFAQLVTGPAPWAEYAGAFA